MTKTKTNKHRKSAAEASEPAVKRPHRETGDTSQDKIEEIATTPAVKTNKAKEQFYAKYDTKKLTSKEILDLQRDKWESKVYKHFGNPPEIIETPGKEVQYKFICKTNCHSSTLVYLHGNLMRHLDSCQAKVAPAGQGINDFAHRSTYSKSKLCYLCALWVAQNHRPYTIVQDDELLQIFRMLYSRVEVPHPTTLSRDVREIYEMTRLEIARRLQAHTGQLHVCVDGWTAPNIISFLGVTVRHVEDGKMKSFILDFIKLVKGHTGVYLAKELRTCFKRYSIETKLLGFVANNASNNQVVAVELESLGGINGAATRVRCFAHILNLVVKAIIIIFAQKPKEAVASSPGLDTSSDDELSDVSDDDGSGDKNNEGSDENTDDDEGPENIDKGDPFNE